MIIEFNILLGFCVLAIFYILFRIVYEIFRFLVFTIKIIFFDDCSDDDGGARK